MRIIMVCNNKNQIYQQHQVETHNIFESFSIEFS